MDARFEELYGKLWEQEASAPIIGMGEFIPACKREIAKLVGACIMKSTDPPPIPMDQVRLIMDNNDMKKPMALFYVPRAVTGMGPWRYLCTINSDRTQLRLEYLPDGQAYAVEYHRSANG